MAATTIQWCDHSINPVRARLKSDPSKVGHYCEKIAPGCTNCYSSVFQPRFGLPEFGSGQKRELVDLFLDETKLDEVRRRRKPTRYFWCDMTDIFGDWMQPEWLTAIFATIDATPQHTHILLTKRPQNVRRMWPRIECVRQNPPDLSRFRINCWLLTSISDQPTADAMIPPLLECRDLVLVLGVSYEPAIGPVDFDAVWPGGIPLPGQGPYVAGIDWVIVGGESGPHARPFNIAWARDVIAQCKDAGVACFVKQLGAHVHTDADDHGWGREFVPLYVLPDGRADERFPLGYRVMLKDAKGGNWDEWPSDMRVREFPKGA